MSAQPSEPTSEAFRELVQVQIEIANLDLAGEQDLQNKLSEMDGVERVSIGHGEARVCYDPLRVTQRDLSAAVAKEGYTVRSAEAHRASLMTEAEGRGD